LAGRTQGDGHEYRVALSAYALFGMVNGIVDALSDDFTAKYFLANILNTIMTIVIVYEMAVMGKPQRPILASLLLVTTGTLGYISAWHIMWSITWTLFRGPIPDPLWLAPNIEMPYTTYTLLTLTALAAYTTYVLLANTSDKVKQIYTPQHLHRKT